MPLEDILARDGAEDAFACFYWSFRAARDLEERRAIAWGVPAR